jgi:hypothetical protein
MLRRLLQGDPGKRSRFHDYEGNVAPLPALLFLPVCAASTFRKKLTGVHPRRPWLGYRAVRRLSQLLQPHWRVLEFGSGNSTPWLARRCTEVLSIETDRDWYLEVCKMIESQPGARVVLSSPPYTRIPEADSKSFDFALVDGVQRDDAMRAALTRLRPGGYVYLDNADVDWDDHREARRLLIAACEPDSLERFIDLTPGQVTVTQGLLGRLKPSGHPGRATE